MDLPTVLALALPLLAALVLAGAGAAEPELIANPRFRQHETNDLSASWQPWGPGFHEAQAAIRLTPQGLMCEAPGKPFAVGGLLQDVAGIQGRQAYAVPLEDPCRDGVATLKSSHCGKHGHLRVPAARPQCRRMWLPRVPGTDSRKPCDSNGSTASRWQPQWA
jgi:hypothetical protein